eukprot:7124598-Prymnesium_polylepis.1
MVALAAGGMLCAWGGRMRGGRRRVARANCGNAGPRQERLRSSAAEGRQCPTRETSPYFACIVRSTPLGPLCAAEMAGPCVAPGPHLRGARARRACAKSVREERARRACAKRVGAARPRLFLHARCGPPAPFALRVCEPMRSIDATPH